MKTPPLLLGAALLFWGFEAGLLPLVAALGVALEASRFVRWRWDAGLKEFSRISDVCAVLLAALTVYLYVTRPAQAAFINLVRLVPLLVFPVVLAQAFSVRGAVDAAALFATLRRRGAAAGAGSGTFLDVSRPFLALCVLAAAAVNVRTPVFYAGMFLLFSWLLWPLRPRYARSYVWVLLLALAGLLGYAGQAGLHNLQILLEARLPMLVFGSGEMPSDPYLSHTAIGQLGVIKQSGDIMLRVQRPAGGQTPRLLREASYDSYRSGEWRAREAAFSWVPPSAAGEGWAVSGGKSPEKFLIYARFPKGKGLLALPAGARAVSRLPAAEVSLNRLGAVRADGAPGRAVYEVAWDPSSGPSRDSPPGPGDLALPAEEAALVRRIAGELGLGRLPPGKALPALGNYFSRDFQYSLYQAEGGGGVSPVARFLTRTRRGHCEFFGTASVLLLRAAGIPARYAVGYSVQEYSRLQKAFLVRQRHSHAWALAYVDGAWRDVDNTPASWFEEEASRAAAMEPLGDIWSWLVYKFSTLRFELPASGGRRAAWLLAALAAFFVLKGAYRIFKSGLSGRGIAPGAAPEVQGLDSELYAVEKALAGAGLGRRSWEPMRAWARRVGESGAGSTGAAELERLAALHSRLRFDPAGLPAPEREALRAGARDWLLKRRAEKRSQP
ncbi:MAG: transglutaminase domain-containing protein [Elusimicrobiota bacterium]|nr:transglutaminase domain-containing protein [Elusimicrobiota bacterium]